jgi:hypothetical protein
MPRVRLRDGFNRMRILGFILLVAGWVLVLSALVLLVQEAARGAFIVAGLDVEIVGLVLVARSHPKPRGVEG